MWMWKTYRSEVLWEEKEVTGPAGTHMSSKGTEYLWTSAG